MKYLIVTLFILSGCASVLYPKNPPPVVLTKEPALVIPVVEKPTFVSVKLPEGDWKNPVWSAMTAKALSDLGKELLAANPVDAKDFHPRFSEFSTVERVAFYVNLISAMARFESNFKPSATYQESFTDRNHNRVISRGLLQLSVESANASIYKCGIKKAQELHDPETNIRCAVKILNYWIPKDGRIAALDKSNLGGARYWSVLRVWKKPKGVWTKKTELPSIKSKVQKLMGEK